jgi:hypothetical protein
MEPGLVAAKAVRERAASVLLSSARQGRDVTAVLAALYAILDREEKGRDNG